MTLISAIGGAMWGSSSSNSTGSSNAADNSAAAQTETEETSGTTVAETGASSESQNEGTSSSGQDGASSSANISSDSTEDGSNSVIVETPAAGETTGSASGFVRSTATEASASEVAKGNTSRDYAIATNERYLSELVLTQVGGDSSVQVSGNMANRIMTSGGSESGSKLDFAA